MEDRSELSAVPGEDLNCIIADSISFLQDRLDRQRDANEIVSSLLAIIQEKQRKHERLLLFCIQRSLGETGSTEDALNIIESGDIVNLTFQSPEKYINGLKDEMYKMVELVASFKSHSISNDNRLAALEGNFENLKETICTVSSRRQSKGFWRWR